MQLIWRMSETPETSRFHPNPAKEQKPASVPSGQTDGQNRVVKKEPRDEHVTDVIEEKEKTEKAQRNPQADQSAEKESDEGAA